MNVKSDHRSKFSNLSNWKEAWKKSGLQRDSNPWPPRYRCDALPTELWSPVFFFSGFFFPIAYIGKFTAMITLHIHLHPQYKYELFHICFTKLSYVLSLLHEGICWVLFQTTRAVHFSSNVHYGRSNIFWEERRGLEIKKKNIEQVRLLSLVWVFFLC